MGALEVWEAPLDPPYHITTHEHGGHVMGDDPTDSVVNSFAQSHEAPNLFVIGGGTFPTLSAYNPTATIQALAFRTADYIKREVEGGRCAGGGDHAGDGDGLDREGLGIQSLPAA